MKASSLTAIKSIMIERRVRIIEDAALDAMLLAEILAEMGHGVCAIVATGAEAIAAALQHRPTSSLSTWASKAEAASPPSKKFSGVGRCPIFL